MLYEFTGWCTRWVKGHMYFHLYQITCVLLNPENTLQGNSAIPSSTPWVEELTYACLDLSTYSPEGLDPSSPADPALSSTTGWGPPEQQALLWLPMSVMQLGGGGRKSRKRKWKPSMSHSEVWSTNLSVSTAYFAAAEKCANC